MMNIVKPVRTNTKNTPFQEASGADFHTCSLDSVSIKRRTILGDSIYIRDASARQRFEVLGGLN